ncbi:MAG: thiamine phosphate synthase, partial [Salinisphaeraceae bacterium]|nr:thiamine phosphate synthase [Salinisphaeraceae bacterium]
ATLRGGAGMLQYRDKTAPPEQRHAEAQALRQLCHQYAVPLIINDDIELARAVAADGVHLGGTDASPASARAVLGPQAIIGISGYNNAEAARNPEADYIAFGRLCPSATKPEAPAANLEVFSRARAITQQPLVGIGGINADNAQWVMDAGADWLAVVAAVFAADDIETATQQLCQCMAQRL